MRDDPRVSDYTAGLESVDFDDLLKTMARERAERFTDYLREEAGQTPTLCLGDHLGVINEVQYRLSNAGFETYPNDDGDERVSVFVPPRFLSDLKSEADDLLMPGCDPDADGTRVHGARVYADATLDGEVLAIHEDAIIPQRAGYAWRPYLVRTPEGVVAASVERAD